MKRLPIIVGLVFLGAALVFLNQGIKKSALPDHDEDEQAQQTPPAQKMPPTSDSRAILPPEETVGDPASARHHIMVGWVYNEANQKKPETLKIPLQTIRDYTTHSGDTVSAEIVDLDVPAEDRSPAARMVTEIGVQIDGRSLYSGNVSDSPASSKIIGKQLSDAEKIN